MDSIETTLPTQLKIGAYKLKELAKIENVHYQTVLERKKRGVYVAVVTKSGKSAVESYRYLTLEASNAFRALFASIGDPSSFFPTVPEEPETTPTETVDEKPVAEVTDTF